MTDRGLWSLRFKNVQYIPGFHMKIIAYEAFINGGAYLDEKINWIERIKDDSCVAISSNFSCGSFLNLENQIAEPKK